MGYVEKTLLPGETIVYTGWIHWIRFRWAGIWLGITIAATVEEWGIRVISGMFACAALAAWLAWLDGATSELVVTDKRVILKGGLIRRWSLDLVLSKVESLAVGQSILGRILGYGELTVGAAGQDQKMRWVAAPLEFRRQVQIQSTSSAPAKLAS